MNQTQKKYAMNRVDEIVRSKRIKLEDKHRVLEVRLTGTEKIQKVLTGKVPKRKTPCCNHNMPYLIDVFDFSKWETNSDRGQAKVAEAMKPVIKEATMIKDQIMLGDEAEALKMIEKFQKM